MMRFYNDLKQGVRKNAFYIEKDNGSDLYHDLKQGLRKNSFHVEREELLQGKDFSFDMPEDEIIYYRMDAENQSMQRTSLNLDQFE